METANYERCMALVEIATIFMLPQALIYIQKL